MIRLTIPSIDEKDLKAVSEVLESGFLVQGKYVSAFENEVANYVGTEHAVAVSSCTAALHLSLLAIDINPGDIVLVTTYSWPATANVIEILGAKPVFVDIDPGTYNIDPNYLEDELSRLFADQKTAHKVKAILPVHTFGQMSQMSEITSLANNYEIQVVEDAACALGARYKDKFAGTWGNLGCFSFHPRKAITTGEGGVVTTDDSKLANRIRTFRNHGLDPESSIPDFLFPGFNYRMTEFQAAMGISQLDKIENIIAQRRILADRYTREFLKTDVAPPKVDTNCRHVYQSYVVLLPADIAHRRNDIIEELYDLGIETTIGTWHIPLTSYFRKKYGYKSGKFIHTDRIFSRSLTLPLFETLTYLQQQEIIDGLNSLIN